MIQQTTVGNSPEPSKKSWRPWFWAVSLPVMMTAGWFVYLEYAAPEIPVFSLDSPDPGVVEALQMAQDKVKRDPRSSLAWAEWGFVLYANDFLKESEICFAQAEKLDPNNPIWPYIRGRALLVRNRQEGLVLLRRGVDLFDPHDPYSFVPRLFLAEALLEQNELDQAEEHCQMVLKQEPKNPMAHYLLGSTLLARGNLDASLVHLKLAEDSPFTRKKTCIKLTALHRRLGQLDQGETYQRRAEQGPADQPWPDALLALRENIPSAANASEVVQEAQGLQFFQQGNLPAAEKIFRDGIKRKPEKASYYCNLSMILLALGDELNKNNQGQAGGKKYEEAVEMAGQALRKHPQHAQAYFYLGLAQDRLGHNREAVEALEQGIHLRPERFDYHLELGKILAAGGQKARAKTHLEQALNLAPDAQKSKVQDALDRLKI